jgi:HSP20 family molecular chaperone IbpA
MNNTNTNTMTPGHYSSTERVFSRLPDLFNDNWLTSSIESWNKALDFPNAVYPYNVKLVTNDKGEALKYEIEVALAGIGKKNIDVRVKDSFLHIEINHPESNTEQNQSVLRKGISARSGKLSFSLGEKVQRKKITSTYIDGLLNVVVPVTQPETLDIDIKVM